MLRISLLSEVYLRPLFLVEGNGFKTQDYGYGLTILLTMDSEEYQ